MGNSVFRGLGVALVTPFRDDGTIDYASLERLIEYQISGGADFFCLLATTAETPCLTSGERKWLKDFIVKTINGRKPLIMGCGGNCTASVIDELQQTDFSEIDGILSVCPYYNRPTQEGLYQHFKEISKATNLPIILYNVPSRTGVNMEPLTVAQLANDCDNIVAIKEARGCIEQAKELIRLKPDNLDVLSGDDGLTLQMIEYGAVGAISVVGNALPKQISQIIHLSMEGKIEEAQLIDNTLRDIYQLLFVDGNPAGIKSMLSTMNFIYNNLRLPLLPVRPETAKAIEKNMQTLQINIL